MADVVVHGHLHLHDSAIILGQCNVHNSVGDLVGQFVGVTGQNRFGEAQPDRRVVVMIVHGQ